MTLLSTECQNLRELDRERAIILAISRFLMDGQWLEVLRVTKHKTRKIMSKNGLREHVGNAMQGYAIKRYQYQLTAVNLGKKLEFE